MKIQPCPYCKEDIESDSHYCDQCGNELQKCSQCGTFCKGKFCPRCGGASVKASQTVSPRIPHEEPKEKPKVDAAVTQGLHSSVCQGQDKKPTKLVLIDTGQTFMLRDGAVLGRVTGDYVAQTSSMQFMSGTHARFNLQNGEWFVTDLNSRNGTSVNGVPCLPKAALKKGDVLMIARSYSFRVE